jgi:hypothetical protein
METPARNKERSFCIELKSKTHLKNIAMTNASSEGVLIEGTLGELQQARFAEGVILEVVGSNGILRIDIEDDEIKKPKLTDEKGGETKQ